MRERLHSGELYLPNDESILQEQQECLELLYDFNQTRPGEAAKRQALLQNPSQDNRTRPKILF